MSKTVEEICIELQHHITHTTHSLQGMVAQVNAYAATGGIRAPTGPHFEGIVVSNAAIRHEVDQISSLVVDLARAAKWGKLPS